MVARSNILKKRRPCDPSSPGYRSYCTAVQSLHWNAKIALTLGEEPASLQGEDCLHHSPNGEGSPRPAPRLLNRLALSEITLDSLNWWLQRFWCLVCFQPQWSLGRLLALVEYQRTGAIG